MEHNNTSTGFAKTYALELLFEEKPQIDVASALADLNKTIGAIEHTQKADNHLFFLLDQRVGEGDKTVPCQLLLVHADPNKARDNFDQELQQSWQTPNAEAISRLANHKVLLSDLMAASLSPKKRHLVLSAALHAFVSNSNCIGVVNKRSQQILDAQAIKTMEDPLFPFVNIRFFNGGDQGLIMDSLGLAALGLYDVQCHFVDLDPNQISSLLYNTAYYIFDKNPTFENGHTISGPDDENWTVRYENALIPPGREVLDINPGAANTVGER